MPFQQYKHIYKRVVNKIIHLEDFNFNKNNFFKELHDIWIKMFTICIIHHNWREYKIWPYNPYIILDKIPLLEEVFKAFIADSDMLKIYNKVDDIIHSLLIIK